MVQNWVFIALGFLLEFRVFFLLLFAFIILQIMTGDKKKQQGIFVSVHRKNLVKDKKNSMVQNCIFITLGFLPEFRVFVFVFWIHYPTNNDRGEKKLVGNISDCSQENCSEEKIIIKSVEVRNKNRSPLVQVWCQAKRSEANFFARFNISPGYIFRLVQYFAQFNSSLGSIFRSVQFFARFLFSRF